MQRFSGLSYLKMDIASSFGLDKKDWDERLAFVEENEEHLEQLVPMAESPALFHAGVLALRKAQRGQPSGFPISLDAASSGLQLLACLIGCEDSAKLCGVVSTGHRADAYTSLYRFMLDDLAAPEGAPTIERAQVKQAVMTSLYSSTREPKRVFGMGAQLRTFYQVMETRVPGAWKLNLALQTLWQPFALSHDWTLPDGFTAHVPVTKKITRSVQHLGVPTPVSFEVNQGTPTGRSISPNLIHSIDGMIVREMHRRCTYDPKALEQINHALALPAGGTRMNRTQDKLLIKLWSLYRSSGFLSARVLDLIDTQNIGLIDREPLLALVQSLPQKPFELISIHDCFRCLPSYGNDLRATYNRILSEIAASEMLSFLASQVTGQDMPVTKLGDISAQILDADYALC